MCVWEADATTSTTTSTPSTPISAPKNDLAALLDADSDLLLAPSLDYSECNKISGLAESAFPSDPAITCAYLASQGTVLVGMDISNFIGGAVQSGCQMPYPDRVLETVLNGRALEKAFAFGTKKEKVGVQGAIAGQWERGGFAAHFSARGCDGHEVNVDDKLCCNMLLEMRRARSTIGTVVFCTGDGNDNGGLASLREGVQCAVNDGFAVEVYAWRCNISRHYRDMARRKEIKIIFWDDHVSAISPVSEDTQKNCRDEEEEERVRVVKKIEPMPVLKLSKRAKKRVRM